MTQGWEEPPANAGTPRLDTAADASLAAAEYTSGRRAPLPGQNTVIAAPRGGNSSKISDPPPGSLVGGERSTVVSEAPGVAPERPPGANTPPVNDSHNPVPASNTPTVTVDVSRETSTNTESPLADQVLSESQRRSKLESTPPPLPMKPRVFTVSNQKGGVGKTTTTVNLASALARAGARVLVIDLDPQGNASTALGVDHRSERPSIYEVLVADLPIADVVQQSRESPLLDCIPATIHLAGAEIELVSLVAREQRLRRALDVYLDSVSDPYHYVFIDCPPSLGLLTINAFVAAREVLIPIQCEYYALEGLSQLLSNIQLIEKHLNPALRVSAILLTMFDNRTNLAQQVANEVREHFPNQTLNTVIPRSVRVSEAPSYGQTVISYDFSSTGALSYREAATELAQRSAPKTAGAR
ncbi:MAG: chromosome partitioning protein [Candidatus Lumbricidophila eiseniae]|uniref:Chromosome partitioning protein n=1 Tax=Candidatus Lumbricidiphila eiseniae TaxID=1969409 RepID=A0A2A6FRX4_9MICO|nr:MAG: chromosome partitioning protein [Candidatus Lumbricidophila eiseniae]